jgi:hypothetical protein
MKVALHQVHIAPSLPDRISLPSLAMLDTDLLMAMLLRRRIVDRIKIWLPPSSNLGCITVSVKDLYSQIWHPYRIVYYRLWQDSDYRRTFVITGATEVNYRR